MSCIQKNIWFISHLKKINILWSFVSVIKTLLVDILDVNIVSARMQDSLTVLFRCQCSRRIMVMLPKRHISVCTKKLHEGIRITSWHMVMGSLQLAYKIISAQMGPIGGTTTWKHPSEKILHFQVSDLRFWCVQTVTHQSFWNTFTSYVDYAVIVYCLRMQATLDLYHGDKVWWGCSSSLYLYKVFWFVIKKGSVWLQTYRGRSEALFYARVWSFCKFLQ